MSVFKIFPKKDNTIFEHYPELNYSLNEILFLQEGNSSVSRALIQFNRNDINNILSVISSSNYTCSLKLFSAETYGLSTDTIVDVFLLSEDFAQGVGKATSNPEVTTPSNWSFPITSTVNWVTQSLGITSSYYSEIGGGSWYNNLSSSQTIIYDQSPDLIIDVTNLVSQSVTQNINNGFILKLRDDINNYNNPTLKSLSYFSKDTSTIYSPQLEFKWDDSVHSSSLTEITSKDVSIFVDLQSEYYNSEKIIVDVFASLRYPIKTYQTQSVYTNNYLLPVESCYGIKDISNDLMVIDFDYINTKLSANNSNNYFTLYTEGLEPERYYEVLIKYKFEGGEYISQNKNYFKVIKTSYGN